MMTDAEAGRFWAKVDRRVPDQCWPWQNAKTPAGYGKMGLRRVTRYAHHLSLELSGRPRPSPQAIALHSCDNPSCVNPSHLSWGTQAENMQQAITRGRAPHVGRVSGTKNGNAVLDEEKVALIRSAGGSQRQIAESFGVSRSLVSQIRSGTAWRHSCQPDCI